MLVPDIVRQSVVFIGRGQGDDFRPLGTGFFVSEKTGGYVFRHIVTAAHVVVGKTDPLYFRMNQKAGGFIDVPIPYKDWHHHPDPDKATDVVVIPASPEKFDLKFAVVPTHSAATPEVIKQHSIGVGDEVFVAGLFKNHHGRGLNLPIVRTGNIALMPEEPVLTKFCGYMEAYLIEARSIGGLSGSPVWVNMPPIRVVEGKVYSYAGQQYYLLGLLQGRFNSPVADEDVVVEHDGAKDDRVNSGIGVVVPVSHILETIRQPVLTAMREEIAAKKRAEEGAESQDAEAPQADENPRHKEDFNSLLDAATRGNKPTDRT